jgi:hypothetical protein
MPTTNRESARYLIVVTLGDSSRDRLMALAPDLMNVLKGLSAGPVEQAFNSAARDVLGFLFQSKLSAHQIIAQVQSPNRVEPFLNNSDNLLVVQLGDDFSGFGRSRAWTWLQRH